MTSKVLIKRDSFLWEYLSDQQKGLIEDAELLFANSHNLPEGLSDYSYLVFPVSKAYEGFLKKVFLDMKLIRPEDYYGEDIRIGRVLNPRYTKEFGSVYNRLCKREANPGGINGVADKLWSTWKVGRNLVFHYFPHNFRRLTFDEAKEIAERIIDTMEYAVEGCSLPSLEKVSEKPVVTSLV